MRVCRAFQAEFGRFWCAISLLRQPMNLYRLTHLKELESESIFVLREVAAQFERPVLLFSAGKDSIVLSHLARKAFVPAKG